MSGTRVIHSLAGAEIGGAESFYTRLVMSLNDYADCKTIAFTRPWKARVEALRKAGVDVQTFRFGGRLHWWDHYRYRNAVKAAKPDIVLTYMNRATQLTPRGNYQLVARLGHYYNLKHYRHCDYWIGNSRGICDHMVSGGLPAARVHHIPNFADESPVKPIARDSFDTPKENPIILSAGRLHENKAFDILLRAMERIPEATLWLAGEGPERESLTNLCTELNISGRVRFLGWRNDVASLMQTADLFVCPSRHEGLGNIVMEAWFNGCPIVSTASQGPAELIDNGSTGILTPVDEVEPLSAAIEAVLGNPEEGRRLAKNAAREYAGKFSRQRICEKYMEFFQTISRN